VVGVQLFDSENPEELIKHNQTVSEKLTLLSHKPGRGSRELKDDF